MDDYAVAGKRKSRNDKRAKARFNKYKKGGQFRSTDISLTSKKQDNSNN